jgi:hypothetical protein
LQIESGLAMARGKRLPAARAVYFGRIATSSLLDLALLLSPSLSVAQAENEESVLQEARMAVAKIQDRPAADMTFEGLKLVRDNLGPLVCGMVNGKRFLVGPAGKPPPQIEDASLSASMFNYLWNARCKGMSASEANEAFKRDLK